MNSKQLEEIKKDLQQTLMTNREIADKYGISLSKVYKFRNDLGLHKTDTTKSKSIQKLEKMSEEYWKNRNDKPESKPLQVLIAKYGEIIGNKIHQVWHIIQQDKVMKEFLTKELRE